MKRCTKCGFSNKDFAEKCVKCRANLVETEGWSREPSSSKQTIRVNYEEQEPWDKPAPLVPNRTFFQEEEAPSEKEEKEADPIQELFKLQEEERPSASQTIHRESVPKVSGTPTVKRVVPDREPAPYLVALSLEEEKELRKIELEGQEINLNRTLLDPANNSISRNAHAQLYFKGGSWYLENTTALKTTFVQVNQPVKVSDGDVILIGDSLFKFKKS